MRTKLSIALGGALVLSACSTTYPLVGVIPETGERFTGTATATTGTSTYQITSDTGATCSGTYKADVVYSASQGASSNGVVQCNDGRTGHWAASGTLAGGQGFGTVGGKKFEIYYGQFATYQQIR